jgi:hypothetical protein
MKNEEGRDSGGMLDIAMMIQFLRRDIARSRFITT